MDAASLRTAGFGACRAGDTARAEALLRAVLEQTPDDAAVTHTLAAICVQSGRMDDGLTLFRQAIALQPGQPHFHFNLGLSLRTAQQDVVAQRHLVHALVLFPDFPDAHYHLGQIRQAVGDYAGACHHLARGKTDGTAADCGELLLFNQVFHTRERGGLSPAKSLSPPLVSIVIPCVNHGRFVEEAVRSCLHQSYPAVEIIVVEGGSTDGQSRAIVAGLNHPRLRTVFRTPRRRAGDNRNFGIGLARGEFVCCLDADDRLAPDYIEKAVFVLAVLGYDIAGAGIRTFGAFDTTRGFQRRPGLADFFQGNQLAMGAVFRRERWAAAGGFHDFDTDDTFIYEDWNFWIRMVAMGARVFNINWEHLIHCRQHDHERLSHRRTILPLERQRDLFRFWNADVLPPAFRLHAKPPMDGLPP